MRNIRVSVPKAMIPLRDRELGGLTGVRIPGDGERVRWLRR
jgi:hypothetical protein